MRSRLLAVATFVLVTLAIVIPVTAEAHEPRTYYGPRWRDNLSVPYRFTASVPTTPAGFRRRIIDGAKVWDALSSPFAFTRGSSDYANFPPNRCPTRPRKNGIHYRDIDGPQGTLGVTITCSTASGALWSFQLVLDRDERWYTGTGTPRTGTFDLLSVAAHEFGHATGFGNGGEQGHLGGTLCSSVDTAATMCPFLLPGTTSARSLNRHDAHTFTQAYPTP